MSISEKNKTYIAIDLKSFYASVECVDRGLDPLNTNLVVADAGRTEKTICLAVSPSLKAYGIQGRARLFEVVSQVNQINSKRKNSLAGKTFTGKSVYNDEIENNPFLEIDYIVAPPRMKRYIEFSTMIYDIYLKYVSKEDMHIYSVDEVFIDATSYLKHYNMSAYELTKSMIMDVYNKVGIVATAGIGTNLYLCKIAMDIVAKHQKADEFGVRIAQLDESSYRKLLWTHRPLTDFWRVGKGISKKLESCGIFTMGDIARCSLTNEELLYKLFGINAELLIDHAWGYEPCTMDMIKKYRPKSSSVSRGQVLMSPYTVKEARIIVSEMADSISLEMTEKNIITNQLVLTIGYDAGSLTDSVLQNIDDENIKKDRYGRRVPKHAHGTKNIEYTYLSDVIRYNLLELYDRIIDGQMLVRRITIAANNILFKDEYELRKKKEALAENNVKEYHQLSIFDLEQNAEDNGNNNPENKQNDIKNIEKKEKMQKAILSIKEKYGNNAIYKGISLKEKATGLQRNEQIGGHRS